MDARLLPLCQSALFQGIGEDEARAMLGCIGARTKAYAEGTAILRPGERVFDVGVVLEGAVRMERVDYWGNRAIIGFAEPGQTFGEAYACAGNAAADVGAVAAQDCSVLLLDARRIAESCPSACPFHARLARNLMAALAQRAIALTRKIDHLSRRTTRAKLLAYLSDQAEQAGSSAFSIPFDRQELADYLSVDRSAMCAELSRMRRDGLVDFRRSRFVLKGVPHEDAARA